MSTRFSLLVAVLIVAAPVHGHAADFRLEVTPVTHGPGYVSGDLRLDAGPLWNRDSTQLLVPGIAADESKKRQLFVITIRPAD